MYGAFPEPARRVPRAGASSSMREPRCVPGVAAAARWPVRGHDARARRQHAITDACRAAVRLQGTHIFYVL